MHREISRLLLLLPSSPFYRSSFVSPNTKITIVLPHFCYFTSIHTPSSNIEKPNYFQSPRPPFSSLLSSSRRVPETRTNHNNVFAPVSVHLTLLFHASSRTGTPSTSSPSPSSSSSPHLNFTLTLNFWYVSKRESHSFPQLLARF